MEQYELLDELVRNQLLDDYLSKIADLAHYKPPTFFATQQEWDDQRKLCKAYRKVLRWYSTTAQFNKLPKLPKKVKQYA